ncbi:DUF2231 domain-containing protein [Cryobacterium sp. Sr8]|uniref:DUF2231 domain-containing protein n=1 Tax=Cryobacterium sp. Sr8 TaxID=1259203 RepID=UPI001F541415|nr:DUF2231 domain-containing protein [Cryobacterium sp. Sr8]
MKAWAGLGPEREGIMTDSAHTRSKHPATPLAGPYGHPFHAVVVPIPIGAWAAAVVFDIVAFAGGDPAVFTSGARWLLGIGIVGALVAAVLGLLDYLRIARGTKAKTVATAHMLLNIAAVVVFFIAFLLHFGDAPTVGGFVLAIVGLVGVGISGFLGGEMAYRYGIRVAEESTQAKAFTGAR